MSKETQKDLIGTKVAKVFNGDKFNGEVVDAYVDEDPVLYHIRYSDGDEEDLMYGELVDISEAIESELVTEVDVVEDDYSPGIPYVKEIEHDGPERGYKRMNKEHRPFAFNCDLPLPAGSFLNPSEVCERIQSMCFLTGH